MLNTKGFNNFLNKIRKVLQNGSNVGLQANFWFTLGGNPGGANNTV